MNLNLFDPIGVAARSDASLYDKLSGRVFLGGRTEPTTLIDMLGSPATAGTRYQDLARLGALAYGGWMGAGALGAGSAASGGAGAGSGFTGGFTGTYGGSPGFSGAVAGSPGLNAGAAGSAWGAPQAANAANWGDYLKMANLGMQLMGPRQGPQPQPVTAQQRPRSPQQPQPFSSNSPYVRFLAMRGLLR